MWGTSRDFNSTRLKSGASGTRGLFYPIINCSNAKGKVPVIHMLETFAGKQVFKITSIGKMSHRLRQIGVSGLAGHHSGQLGQDMIKVKAIETSEKPTQGFGKLQYR